MPRALRRLCRAPFPQLCSQSHDLKPKSNYQQLCPPKCGQFKLLHVLCGHCFIVSGSAVVSSPDSKSVISQLRSVTEKWIEKRAQKA